VSKASKRKRGQEDVGSATPTIQSDPPGKRIDFHRACKKALLSFPESVRDGMVFVLRSVARGQSDALSAIAASHGYTGLTIKSLSPIRQKVAEICTQDGQHWYRLAYTTEFRDCVFAVHAFLKKSNQTSKEDRNLILQRVKAAAGVYR
jgi:phage-related protein